MALLIISLNIALLAILLLIQTGCGTNQQDTDSANDTAMAEQTTTAIDEPASSAVTTTTATTTGSNQTSLTGYMTFVINVHDTEHVDESADTILRLIDIYEKYGVRGDFYLTAPLTERYVEERPDVIARLHDSSMTISYHVRPPHPLSNGFDSQIEGLDDTALATTLRDYEIYQLDLATGGLNRSEPGGYAYVAQTFGRNPVTAGAPNNDQRIKNTAETGYAGLGARMTVRYHEEGTDIEQPFEWFNGLLARPSDFSITRWGEPSTKGNGKEPFWWNMLSTPKASEYVPVAYLQKRLGEWHSGNAVRSPFVTSLIHENNFYRSGAEGWTLSYYSTVGKEEPLQPPFDLNAPDPSKLRSPQEQEAIWKAYEEMVAWASTNMSVVTSEDIVKMAGAPS